MIDAYVINLDRHIGNYSMVKDAMDELGGFAVRRFSAIDGKKGEHLEYMEDAVGYICKETCPDSVIAIALSHKKVAHMILDSGVDYALVLEDDVTPIKDGFHEKLQRTLTEVPEDWDIIQLHCHGAYCEKGSNEITRYDASFAAYLLSRSGAQKMLDLLIKNHIDIQTSNDLKFKKFKSKTELFTTDESDSTNRYTDVTLSMELKMLFMNFIRTRKHNIAFLQSNYLKIFGFTFTIDETVNFTLLLFSIIIVSWLKL